MDSSGRLYILATPIGNMQDITLRALDTLKTCDLVVCEDTRVTGKLLHNYDIKKPLKALNEFNEHNVVYDIIQEIINGSVVCLVSDSGTPLVSDPGFLLVREAKKKDLSVIPIPGPSAVIAALSASGLPTDSFLFLGFLPKNKTKRKKQLSFIANTFRTEYKPTIVFYESPHRIVETLKFILEIFGDIEITIAREITKIHEEIKSELLSELINKYSEKEPKGEFTVLFSLK